MMLPGRATIVMIGLVCAAATPLFAADPPHKEISGGGIRVKINLPDAKDGYYKSTRFDWAGQIFSLEYAGHNYYGLWYTQRREGVRDFIYEGNEIVVGGRDGGEPGAETGSAVVR